jgi:hypothetical protein
MPDAAVIGPEKGNALASADNVDLTGNLRPVVQRYVHDLATARRLTLS